jgi:2',3'-cyclic-nucleotide 2'-phosphodiesterase (5'-nucleotidase family)
VARGESGDKGTGRTGVTSHVCTLTLTDISDVIYLDYVEKARRLCKVLREEDAVDLLVALTHTDNTHLGSRVPDIDNVLGGHDHHYNVTPWGGMARL